MTKERTNQLMTNIEGNVQYRNSVFCSYFNDKPRLLSLCNALLNTNYPDPQELEITTLPGTFFNSQKNDISCMIRDKFLVVTEHQTLASENLPFRCLSYVTELLNNLVTNKRLIYRKKLIRFPVPEFFVLYDGNENEPLRKEMLLSEAFGGDSHSLELRVVAYNINYGAGQPLLEKCSFLKDYCIFVSKVKEHLAVGMKHDEAIKNAVHYCLDHGIMKDYLEENAKEVFNMARLEWDINEAKAAWQDEAREEGQEEGARKNLLENIRSLMQNMGLSSVEAMNALSVSPENQKKLAPLI